MLPLTSTEFHNFRTHEPRIRIDGLSESPGKFVARVSASVATTKDCTGGKSISRAADTVFASFFAIPIEGGTGSAEALSAATPSAEPTYLYRRSTQKTAPAATTGSTVSVSALLGIPAPPSSTMRRRNATATGNAPPLYVEDSGPGGAPRPSSRRGTTPPRVPRPWPAPQGAPTVRPRPRKAYIELLSYGSRLLLVTRRLHIQGRTPSATLLNCGSLIPSRVIHIPIGSESSKLSRRATLRCVTSLSAGHRSYRPKIWRATSRTSIHPSQTSRSWRVRVDYIQPTTTSSYSSLTRHCR